MDSDPIESPSPRQSVLGKSPSRATTSLGSARERCRTMSMQQAAAEKSKAHASALSTKGLFSRNSSGISLHPPSQDTKNSAFDEPRPQNSFIYELLESGVYDNTGISRNRISVAHSAQTGEERPRCPTSRDTEYARTGVEARGVIYQDKGTMVNLGLDPSSKLQPLDQSHRTNDSLGLGRGIPAKTAQSIPTIPKNGPWLSRDPQGQRYIMAGQPRLDTGDYRRSTETAETSYLPYSQESEPRIHNFPSIDLERAARYKGRDANQAFRETNPVGELGSHAFFKFPGNLPSVQPLSYGASLLHEPSCRRMRSGATSPHTRPSAAAWLNERDGGERTPHFERRRLNDPVVGMTDKPVPDFIARLEHEAMDLHLNQSFDERRFAREIFFDKETIDLQLHQVDRGEPPMAKGGASHVCNGVKSSECCSIREPAATSPRPLQPRHDLGDTDMTGFWRPNYFR